jgi:hypothetical protein
MLGSGSFCSRRSHCSGGCGAKRVLVMVPPELDLARYQAIGVVEFSGSDRHLSAAASRQFREDVLAAQPGVRLVELDGEAEVAALAGRGRIEPARCGSGSGSTRCSWATSRFRR